MFGEGKVAVVTGVGPGVGRSVALGFARNGVDVVLAARQNSRLESVAEEIRQLAGNRWPSRPTSPELMRARR